MTSRDLEAGVPERITLVTPGRTGGAALYSPHEPSPSEDQGGSHKTQDEPVEHIWAAAPPEPDSSLSAKFRLNRQGATGESGKCEVRP